MSNFLTLSWSLSHTDCLNSCHSEGHFARDCPEKPANICFNCKKEGCVPCRSILTITSNGIPGTLRPSVPKSVLMTALVVSVRSQVMLPAIVLISHLRSAAIASTKVGELCPLCGYLYLPY